MELMVLFISLGALGLGRFGWSMAMPDNFSNTVDIAVLAFITHFRHCRCQSYCWSCINSTESSPVCV